MFDKISYFFLWILVLVLNVISSDSPDLGWVARTTGVTLPETYEVVTSEYEIMLGEETAHYELMFDSDSCSAIIAELENLESLASSQQWEWGKEGANYVLHNEGIDSNVDAIFGLDPSRLEGSCIFDFTILTY